MARKLKVKVTIFLILIIGTATLPSPFGFSERFNAFMTTERCLENFASDLGMVSNMQNENTLMLNGIYRKEQSFDDNEPFYSLDVEIIKGAADYVVSKAISEHGGYKWAWETSKYTHYDPCLGHGAAGVGLFLLNAYKITENETYLYYAKGAAQWIIGEAQYRDGGITWPSYDDENPRPYGWFLTPDKSVSGVAKFLLELYDITGNETYLYYAKGAAQWIMNTALEGSGESVYVEYNPYHQAAFGIYSYVQRDVGDLFLKLYNVTGEQIYLDKAKTIANWIAETAEPAGDGKYKWYDDRGYKNVYQYSGVAVLAEFLLKIYKVTGVSSYFNVGKGFIEWMIDGAVNVDSGVKFPQWPSDDTYYTIIPGVWNMLLSIRCYGEVFLVGYELTGDERYLEYASRYANWLKSCMVQDEIGYKIPAIEGTDNYSPFVNAIVYSYFVKLYKYTNNSTYSEWAEELLRWIDYKAVKEYGYTWPDLNNRVTLSYGASGIGYYLSVARKTLRLSFKLNLFTDPRLSVKTIGPVTIPMFSKIKIKLHIVSRSSAASFEDYCNAILQYLGIDLTNEGYQKYPYVSVLIFELENIYYIIDYIRNVFPFFMPEWLFNQTKAAYMSPDGAARLITAIGFTVKIDINTVDTMFKVASLATSLVKAIMSRSPKEFLKDTSYLLGLVKDLKNLIEDLLNIGLYVFQGNLTCTAKLNSTAIFNLMLLLDKIISIISAGLKSYEFFKEWFPILRTAIFWLRMGIDFVTPGIGTFDLLRALLSYGVTLLSTFLELIWWNPTGTKKLVLNFLRLFLRIVDPPRSGVYISIYNATSGAFLLGYDPISKTFVNESSVGFIIFDNNSQYMLLERSSFYNVTLSFVGKKDNELPFTFFLVDQYANITFGSTGMLGKGKHLSILLNTTGGITEISNYLVVKSSISNVTLQQGQPLTINVSVTDSAGKPCSNASVILLIDNTTWIMAENLGSGNYQVILDTSNFTSLIQIAVYAYYKDKFPGYDSLIVNIIPREETNVFIEILNVFIKILNRILSMSLSELLILSISAIALVILTRQLVKILEERSRNIYRPCLLV